MTALVKYEAARHALQVAKQVDEVKDIRDKAQAMAAYARQAKDDELIKWATEIKLRAERRAGELLAESEKHKGGNPKLTGNTKSPVGDPAPSTLAEVGLSKKQSSDFQAIASIPEDEFEKAVATGNATTKSLVDSSPKKKKTSKKKASKPPATMRAAPPLAQAHEELKDKYVEIGQELERADKEIRSLQALVESLQTSDLAKELKKAHLKYEQLEARLLQCNTTRAEAEKQARYQSGLLSKIRTALKVKKDSEILAAIKA